eukprot:TRINITY_DN80630_c0_g1_i1.p1 TRINITY_DN80630_c0_g1~~TRINITY_DN80630_c0_g1_i1.p1  ORF type:complete len:423 (-),score=70.79 TRINITY_DN80630_c0_g1_i1:155-1423(-)
MDDSPPRSPLSRPRARAHTHTGMMSPGFTTAAAEDEAPRTPGPARRSSMARQRNRRHSMLIQRPADEDTGSQSDDSKLDASFEADDCSTVSDMSSCAPMSVPSSSWSPASINGIERRRESKRRSISELSQSARMTPKELERRGLGIPWQRQPNLCTIDLQPGEAAERAREFCLIPTPELMKGGTAEARSSVSPPTTPDQRSPSTMQRSFVQRVWRASLGQSPESEGTYGGAGPSSIEASPIPSRLSNYDMLSPIMGRDSESLGLRILSSPEPRTSGATSSSSTSTGAMETSFTGQAPDLLASQTLMQQPLVPMLPPGPRVQGAAGLNSAEARHRILPRVQQQILKGRRKELFGMSASGYGGKLQRVQSGAKAAQASAQQGRVQRENQHHERSPELAAAKENSQPYGLKDHNLQTVSAGKCWE